MSSDLRWTKWWWADWQTDPALRMCSLAARGLWLEMLALMHNAEPQGHLLVSGRTPSVKQLSALVGASEKEVARLTSELEEAEVFSRTEDGVIFSRRMVRDNAKREEARQNGKMGGNPALKANSQSGVSGVVKRPGLRRGKPNGFSDGLTPHANPGVGATLKLEAEAEAEEDSAAKAAAQAVGSDDDEADPRSVLFRRGLDTIARLCGKPARSLRGFVGLLLQQAGDDPRLVLEAIDAADAMRPAEPQSWIRNAVRTRMERPKSIEDEPWFRDLAAKEQSTGRWCFAGFYVDDAVAMVRDAARIPDAEARNWEPLARWLDAGRDLHDDVLPAIRRMASRPGYQPPASLRFFEAAVLGNTGASS